MNSAIEYLGIAALIAMRTQATKRGLPRTRADFGKEFQERYNRVVEEVYVDKALKQLEAWGYLAITEDRYAGESLRFSKLSTDEAMTKALPKQVAELYEKAWLGGLPWLNDVLANRQFWIDVDGDNPRYFDEDVTVSDNSGIPASDRIVYRSDNQGTLDLLAADLRGIGEEMRESNEVSIELGDERDLIEGEIKAAEILVSQPRFRLQRLYGLILPSLRFLAEKFVSGAIGEMAKRLIALLIGLA